MQIGFIISADLALATPGNGARNQAVFQAQALQELGHEVRQLNPWEIVDCASLDVVQFFVGGFRQHRTEAYRSDLKLLAFAPMIDSNQPTTLYRLAAWLGHLCRLTLTLPAVYQDQANGSDLVICRSSDERKRLVAGLGIDQRRVEMIPLGVHSPIDADPEGVRRRYDLPAEFVLHVSNYTRPNKNVIRMVEAIGPTKIPLVVVGSGSTSAVLSRLQELAEKYRNVRLLGYLEPQDLASIYAACKVLCLPSVHEGVGLAALEAATYGADVVITKNGGAPDYFLDMAEYVNPYDVNDIRDAVVRAFERPRTDRLRQHLLTNLTWRQSAEKLVAAYEKHKRR